MVIIKEYKKYLRMWYASFLFLGLSVIFFLVSMYFPRLYWWLIDLVTVVVFIGLFIPSNKALMQDEGYTIMEARTYYIACNKAGLGKTFELKECRKIAEKYPYASKLDDSALKKLYSTGKSFFRLE